MIPLVTFAAEYLDVDNVTKELSFFFFLKSNLNELEHILPCISSSCYTGQYSFEILIFSMVLSDSNLWQGLRIHRR